MAFALSAGGTALSAGLVALAAQTKNVTMAEAGLLSSLITPAAGEFYAGKPVTWGIPLRLVSGVLVVAGARELFSCFLISPDSTCHRDNTKAALLLGGGTIGYAAGIVYDIATAGTAVDEYNRKHQLRVAPTVLQTGASGATLGVGIGGSF